LSTARRKKQSLFQRLSNPLHAELVQLVLRRSLSYEGRVFSSRSIVDITVHFVS